MSVDRLRAQLAGAGGIPDIPTVVRLRGHITLGSDTTIGGSADEDDSIIRLDRDTATGRPRWRGTGQAGVLRHHLAALLGTEHAALVFGTGSGPSPVHSTDSLAYRADGGYPLVEKRDGNRVDPESGIVARGAVFTEEVLTAGSSFPVDWSIHARPEQLVEITAGFVRALDGFSDDSNRLGRRRGKGRGAATLTGWSVDLHDLTTAEGFRSWYTRAPAPHWRPPVDPPTELVGRLDEILPGVAARVDQLRALDQRSRIVIRMRLALGETILGSNADAPRPATMVQGTGRESSVESAAAADSADPGPGGPHADRRAQARTPLTRPLGPDGTRVPIDSGSAVHSLLKQRTGWILHEIADHADDPELAHDRAEQFLADLFGADADAPRRPGAPRPSRVTVTEAAITRAGMLRLPHVRIDPLTQGAVDHHLFFDDVLVGGGSEITVIIDRPHLPDLGALAWVLRDLHLGATPPMGAATTNGHGRRMLTDAELDIPAGLRDSDTEPRRYATWAEFATGKNADLPKAAISALERTVQEGHR